MSDNKYNGWTNYETWAVKLWMDNDQGSQEHWNEAAQDAWGTAKGNEDNRDEASRDARIALAERLKDEHEEAAPDLKNTVWADLLNAAIGEVDWHEIADALLSDLDIEDEGYKAR